MKVQNRGGEKASERARKREISIARKEGDLAAATTIQRGQWTDLAFTSTHWSQCERGAMRWGRGSGGHEVMESESAARWLGRS